jgi:hypothetical protein
VESSALVVDDTRWRIAWPPGSGREHGTVVQERLPFGPLDDIEALRDPLTGLRSTAPPTVENTGALVVAGAELPFAVVARVIRVAVDAGFTSAQLAVSTPGGPRALRLAIPPADSCLAATGPPPTGGADRCALVHAVVGADSLTVTSALASRAACFTATDVLLRQVIFAAPLPGSRCEVVPRERTALAELLSGAAVGCRTAALSARPGPSWGEVAPVWAQLETFAGPKGVMVMSKTDPGGCHGG